MADKEVRSLLDQVMDEKTFREEFQQKWDPAPQKDETIITLVSPRVIGSITPEPEFQNQILGYYVPCDPEVTPPGNRVLTKVRQSGHAIDPRSSPYFNILEDFMPRSMSRQVFTVTPVDHPDPAPRRPLMVKTRTPLPAPFENYVDVKIDVNGVERRWTNCPRCGDKRYGTCRTWLTNHHGSAHCDMAFQVRKLTAEGFSSCETSGVFLRNAGVAVFEGPDRVAQGQEITTRLWGPTWAVEFHVWLRSGDSPDWQHLYKRDTYVPSRVSGVPIDIANRWRLYFFVLSRHDVDPLAMDLAKQQRWPELLRFLHGLPRSGISLKEIDAVLDREREATVKARQRKETQDQVARFALERREHWRDIANGREEPEDDEV
jgi:hypothetical protein